MKLLTASLLAFAMSASMANAQGDKPLSEMTLDEIFRSPPPAMPTAPPEDPSLTDGERKVRSRFHALYGPYEGEKAFQELREAARNAKVPTESMAPGYESIRTPCSRPGGC